MPLLYFFLGVTCLQIIFTGVYFVLLRRKEYLYYTLFSVCLALLVVLTGLPSFSKSLSKHLGWAWFLLIHLILPLVNLLYYRFMRHFSDAEQKFPSLNHRFKIAEKLVFFSVILLALIRWIFSINDSGQSLLFLIAPINLFLLISVLQLKKRLMNIVAIGSFLLFLCVRVAIFTSYFGSHSWLIEATTGTFILIGGVMLNYLFFDIALIYKTQLVYGENLQLAVEKQHELSLQRLSISNDLHDDIGSSLSSIQLELALTKNNRRSKRRP